MKIYAIALTLMLAAPLTALAQNDPVPVSIITPTPSAPAVSAPAPVAPATVAVAAPSAPPVWLQEFLSTVSSLPIVGPYLSKAIVWIQALGGILTALVAFLLAVSAGLKAAFNFTGLDSVVSWIESFQQSSIMYWLTSLSNVPVHMTPAGNVTPAPAAPVASAS